MSCKRFGPRRRGKVSYGAGLTGLRPERLWIAARGKMISPETGKPTCTSFLTSPVLLLPTFFQSTV